MRPTTSPDDDPAATDETAAGVTRRSLLQRGAASAGAAAVGGLVASPAQAAPAQAGAAAVPRHRRHRAPRRTRRSGGPAPRYTDVAYGGESVRLANAAMRVDIFKRTSGWGWAEISRADGKLMAVLPHFGEVTLAASSYQGHLADIPRRMEAKAVELGRSGDADTATLKVAAQSDRVVADGSFYDQLYGDTSSVAEGQVVLSLHRSRPVLTLSYDVTTSYEAGFLSFRGPWLLVGQDAFGSRKHDAIFPGIEWLEDDEHSSAEGLLERQALRFAPHPFKVSAPVMAVSHAGTAISLSWTPDLAVKSFAPLERERYVQPVFASPDFVTRGDRHLMGLMLPTSATTQRENELYPTEETPVESLSSISFSADVALSEGTSHTAIVDWVRRTGLPAPAKGRLPLGKALHVIARSYNSNLWFGSAGWGQDRESAVVEVPPFLPRYLAAYGTTPLGKALAGKLAYIRTQPDFSQGNEQLFAPNVALLDRSRRLALGERLLAAQRADGAFPLTAADFEAEGLLQHAAILRRPLGRVGDTALAFTVTPAVQLLRLWRLTGDERFRRAGLRALDSAIDLERPEGGEWPESPLHAPSLAGAGEAAIAYELGYQASKRAKYRRKARYWLRSLLVLTHLWEPRTVRDLYFTKPGFFASVWFDAEWIKNHVMWIGVAIMANAIEFGIDWKAVDPEIDWRRYQTGMAQAATHSLVTKGLKNHRYDDALVASGSLDGLLADGHDAVTGESWGGLVMSGSLALLIMEVQAGFPTRTGRPARAVDRLRASHPAPARSAPRRAAARRPARTTLLDG